MSFWEKLFGGVPKATDDLADNDDMEVRNALTASLEFSAKESEAEAPLDLEIPANPTATPGQLTYVFVVLSHPVEHNPMEIIREVLPGFIPPEKLVAELAPNGKVAAYWTKEGVDEFDIQGATLSAFEIKDPDNYNLRNMKALLYQKGAAGAARCLFVYRT